MLIKDVVNQFPFSIHSNIPGQYIANIQAILAALNCTTFQFDRVREKGYGAAFAAVMAEGVGIPTPGQTLLIAGAAEAAQGRMNIMLLLFLVTAAATLGNSVGYVIGRWGWPRGIGQAEGQPPAAAVPR